MRSSHWVVPKVGTVIDTTRNPNHPTLRAECSYCGVPITYVNKTGGPNAPSFRRPTWRHLQEVIH